MASSSLLHKAVYVVPLAFAVGLFVNDYVKSLEEEEAAVERKVQQRLGLWRPPLLPARDRELLLTERAALQAEISAVEAKLAARRRSDAAAKPPQAA